MCMDESRGPAVVEVGGGADSEKSGGRSFLDFVQNTACCILCMHGARSLDVWREYIQHIAVIWCLKGHMISINHSHQCFLRDNEQPRLGPENLLAVSQRPKNTQL